MERRVNSSKTPIVSELQPRSIRSMACFLQLMDVALSSWHGNDGVERAMLFFSLSLSSSWRDSSMLVLEILTGHSQTYDQGRVLFAIPFTFYNKGIIEEGGEKAKE